MTAPAGHRAEPIVRGALGAQPRFTWFLILAAAAVAALNLARLLAHLIDGELITPYKATLYWVDYRDGFVRRGLPGEVLSWLTGGAPTYGAMIAAGLALSLAACGAGVLLARRLASQAVTPTARLAVAVVVVAAPFTVPLMARDLGRYDAIGVLAFAVVALLPARWRWSPWAAAGVLSVAVAVACASEEFLGAFLAPVGLLAAYQLGQRQVRRAAPFAALILGPGALLSVASLVIGPSAQFIQNALDRAHAAGVGPSTAPGNDAATLLGATLDEQLALFGQYDPSSRVLLPIGIGALFVALAWTLSSLLGRPAPRLFVGIAVWLGLVAVVLGVVGVDFLRWWSLAMVAFVAALAVARPAPVTASGPLPVRMRLMISALVLVCVITQDIPIAPASV